MIHVKTTTTTRDGDGSQTHTVELYRHPDDRRDPAVCFAYANGLQGSDDSAPNPASLATTLLLKFERDVVELIDGIDPVTCLDRYTENMRSEGPPEWLLTAKQKAKAQELWSSGLRLKVSQSKRDDAERAPRVVVDRDLDEVE